MTPIGWILIGLLALLSAILCALAAKRSGKDPWTWFLIGITANLFAFVFFSMAKKINSPATNKPKGG